MPPRSARAAAARAPVDRRRAGRGAGRASARSPRTSSSRTSSRSSTSPPRSPRSRPRRCVNLELLASPLVVVVARARAHPRRARASRGGRPAVLFGDALVVADTPSATGLRDLPAGLSARIAASVREVRFVGPILGELPRRKRIAGRVRPEVIVSLGGGEAPALAEIVAGALAVDADLVVVAAQPSDELARAADELRRSGRSVTIVDFLPDFARPDRRGRRADHPRRSRHAVARARARRADARGPERRSSRRSTRSGCTASASSHRRTGARSARRWAASSPRCCATGRAIRRARGSRSRSRCTTARATRRSWSSSWRGPVRRGVAGTRGARLRPRRPGTRPRSRGGDRARGNTRRRGRSTRRRDRCPGGRRARGPGPRSSTPRRATGPRGRRRRRRAGRTRSPAAPSSEREAGARQRRACAAASRAHARNRRIAELDVRSVRTAAPSRHGRAPSRPAARRPARRPRTDTRRARRATSASSGSDLETACHASAASTTPGQPCATPSGASRAVRASSAPTMRAASWSPSARTPGSGMVAQHDRGAREPAGQPWNSSIDPRARRALSTKRRSSRRHAAASSRRVRRERMDGVETGQTAAERRLRPAAQLEPAATADARGRPPRRGLHERAIAAQGPRPQQRVRDTTTTIAEARESGRPGPAAARGARRGRHRRTP